MPLLKNPTPMIANIKKANARALKTLRASLDKDLLHVFAHYDSALVVWSIMTSPELPKIIDRMRRSRKDKSDDVASWSKGMTPLRYNRNLY